MKLLIVDDSIVYRTAISQALENVPDYEIVKTCSNGKIAVDYLRRNPDVDLITLDMEMPVMDGMETLKEIRKFNNNVGIIVFSAVTVRGAEKTIDALSSGANDFVTKIEGKGTIEDSIGMIKQELVPKINAIFRTRAAKSIGGAGISDRQKLAKAPIAIPTALKDSIAEENSAGYKIETDIEAIVSDMRLKPKLLCIGSSTGGPDALTKFFGALKEVPTFPMLLVQHMPPVFTGKLAEALDKASVVTVREAKGGERIENGVCYLAPGDYHMTIDKEGIIHLNQNDKVCFVRPAVNVLYDSVAENFKQQVMAFVMTGMGDDGADGMETLKKVNAYEFIQDQDSSVVWGMPGSVHRKGLGAKILKLEDFAPMVDLISKRI
jgi:two-component system chemotaxis response regulator CheB